MIWTSDKLQILDFKLCELDQEFYKEKGTLLSV